MNEHVNRDPFLETVINSHRDWEGLLDQVGDEWATQPGVAGEGSIKDIVAHVAWGEREMVNMLRTRALVGSDLWNLPQDARNATVYEQNRSRSLRAVQAEERQIFQELTDLIRALSDEDLNDPHRFAHMPENWAPWQVIAGNTTEHYQAHMPSIQNWLDQLGKRPVDAAEM